MTRWGLSGGDIFSTTLHSMSEDERPSDALVVSPASSKQRDDTIARLGADVEKDCAEVRQMGIEGKVHLTLQQ
jgi:hypothetical protein